MKKYEVNWSYPVPPLSAPKTRRQSIALNAGNRILGRGAGSRHLENRLTRRPWIRTVRKPCRMASYTLRAIRQKLNAYVLYL